MKVEQKYRKLLVYEKATTLVVHVYALLKNASRSVIALDYDDIRSSGALRGACRRKSGRTSAHDRHVDDFRLGRLGGRRQNQGLWRLLAGSEKRFLRDPQLLAHYLDKLRRAEPALATPHAAAGTALYAVQRARAYAAADRCAYLTL